MFYLSQKTIQSLTNLCKETGTEILEPVILGRKGVRRFNGRPALAFLESHLFRTGKNYFAGGIFYLEKPSDEISIHACANPREEAEFAARTILKLTREQKLAFREIALISGDMETYAREIRLVFPKYGIPCFIDEKHSILMNPFVEYIRAAVNLVVEHFSYESMFRYLRCGLSGIPVYQVDQLENYCIAVEIRGEKQWNDHWVRRYRGMEEGSIEAINKIRKQVWEKIGSFAAYMKEKEHTVEERTRMLYHMIVKDRIQERLAEKEQDFAAQGDQAMVKEYSQIYGMIMELLDKMVQMLGSETITAKEYGQLLDVGFQEMRVGIIPPTADQVLLGEMERTRLKDIKVLFFAGSTMELSRNTGEEPVCCPSLTVNFSTTVR